MKRKKRMDVEECAVYSVCSDTSLTKSLSEEEEASDDPILPMIHRKHREADWLSSRTRSHFPGIQKLVLSTIHRIANIFWRRRLPRLAVMSLATLLIFYHLQSPSTASSRIDLGHIPTRAEGQALLQAIRQTTTSSLGLTLQIRGSVLPVLQTSIQHYKTCHCVDQIQVLDISIPSRLLQEKVTASTTPRNNAVLLIDASILLSCNDLENALSLWKQDPTRLVGWGSTTLLSDEALLGHWSIIEKYTTPTSTLDPCQHFSLSAKWVAASQQAVLPMVSSRYQSASPADFAECYPSILQALGERSLPSSSMLYTGYSSRIK